MNVLTTVPGDLHWERPKSGEEKSLGAMFSGGGGERSMKWKLISACQGPSDQRGPREPGKGAISLCCGSWGSLSPVPGLV